MIAKHSNVCRNWSGVLTTGHAPLLLVFTLALCAAPAPVPRERPGRLPGEYVAHWGDTQAPTRLTPDGKYECLWHEAKWVGKWWHDREGQLCIEEHVQGGTTIIRYNFTQRRTTYGYSLHHQFSDVIRVRLERKRK